MASKETESRKQAGVEGARSKQARGLNLLNPEEQAQAINQGSIEAQLKAAKQRKLELLEAQRVYRQSHALEFFVPQDQQQPFFKDFTNPEHTLFVLLGGNRSGKSAALIAAAASLGIGRYPWMPVPAPLPQPKSISVTPGGLLVDGTLYESDKAYKQARAELATDHGLMRAYQRGRPLKIRIVAEDYAKAIGQTILPKFFEFMPPELIASKRKGQTGVYDQVVLTNGTVYDFLTYAQDSSMMEGWDGDAVFYDEPPPRPVFIANARGLVDRNGVTVFAMTPLKEPWIANELVNKPNSNARVYKLRSYDNPHIDKDALDRFVGLLSDEERQTRTEGDFLHLQGMVFKEFDKTKHVIKPFKLPSHYTHYVAIDTHPRTQQALLFIAVDDHDRAHVVHEIFKHGTPEQVAEWIVEYHENIHPVYTAVIEPASQGDANRGDTTYQIIERALTAKRIPLCMGSKDLASGIQIVREALRSANGQSSLFIFDSCPRLIYEFANYIWDDWSKATDRNERQKPRDKDDHLIECLRRLLQLPARYVDRHAMDSLISQANAGYRPRDPLAGI